MSTESRESWTPTHDLSLVFVALAHGTDNILADEELSTIVDIIGRWQPGWDQQRVQEVVMESLAVYLDGSNQDELVRAVNRLKKTLEPASLLRALEDATRVAEADGIVLGSERSIISILARAWNIRDLPGEGSADGAGGWGILHDVGLMYVVVAHAGDADLSDPEITAMVSRLTQWQPDLEEAGARKVLREALQYYATQPDSDAFTESVISIKSTFPLPQRIAVLDDLAFIAEADGTVGKHEEEIITTLSSAWEVDVNLERPSSG